MISIIKKKISTITYLPAKLDNHEIDKNLTLRENLKHINQNNMTITNTIGDKIKEMMISRIAAVELRVKADVAVDAVKFRDGVFLSSRARPGRLFERQVCV